MTSSDVAAGAGFTSPTGHESGPVYRVGEWLAADHWLTVPVDHRDPSGTTTEVYARELRRPDSADRDLPYLLFLQGGPGGASPRPDGGPAWIGWALERYRVLLLDQRGTGRSNPLDPGGSSKLGSPEQQAEHLACFRADAIVEDCELLRRELLGDQPWTTLGQSFGGFCTFTYLSFHPQSLVECYVTGGVPPLTVSPDEAYRSTYRMAAQRTADLDALHPRTRDVLRDVARHLADVDERLPDGERLTVQRLQEVGQLLGSENGPLRLRYLAECAWAGDRLSAEFAHQVAGSISLYAESPLYALIHEPCLCDEGVAARWSAERVRAEDPGIDAADGLLVLTGEAIYRHTVARQPALAPFVETAEILAEKVWDRPLYDVEALSRNQIPVAARAYTQDMYVTWEHTQATAAVVPNVHLVPDEAYHHDALRKHGVEVMSSLRDVLDRVGGS